MTVSIAHLGPSGTYSEQAAIAYRDRLQQEGQETALHPYPSIPQTLKAVAQGETQIAVVPVENSIEGSVAVTLDMMWLLDTLQIQLALVLPIAHVLLSHAQSLDTLQVVYSHPQALAQCQLWFTQFLPRVQLIPTNSTTEALQHLERAKTAGAISSLRAAKLYHLPVLASGISDYPDNCTRFWVLSRQSSTIGSHTSLAFSLPANVPGALVKPLQVFAQRNINLSRIESRPTKRSLGEYLYFIDLEGDSHNSPVKSALTELTAHTEILKNFGSYTVVLLNQNN
ncbi:prephenate dehydratase [Chroococcidiopsis sp. FACHB-1243]|uniref:prephenate dehydratase n=1 Tax=Chroococcidiopsis sp. [FACHB-1243] TaxID=2692781 RepID=UPI00177C1C62|nr:prephenate dehydratase [Chroococcidiopsis sp. [FACHB-1243]]MBD2307157.1 prephenate dehydratase [Chroococcidiopsis sp. [FACHB-1243]]